MSPLVVYMDIWRWNSMNDESGRLIADITETWNLEQLEGFLAAIDFEKAFGSLNLDFTITVLEHHGFGNEFIEWIKISLKMKNPVW